MTPCSELFNGYHVYLLESSIKSKHRKRWTQTPHISECSSTVWRDPRRNEVLRVQYLTSLLTKQLFEKIFWSESVSLINYFPSQSIDIERQQVWPNCVKCQHCKAFNLWREVRGIWWISRYSCSWSQYIK